MREKKSFCFTSPWGLLCIFHISGAFSYFHGCRLSLHGKVKPFYAVPCCVCMPCSMQLHLRVYITWINVLREYTCLVDTWWQWLAKTSPNKIHLHLPAEGELEHCMQEAAQLSINSKKRICEKSGFVGLFFVLHPVVPDKGSHMQLAQTPLDKNTDISGTEQARKKPKTVLESCDPQLSDDTKFVQIRAVEVGENGTWSWLFC